jgi:ankyrin repeat protein
LNDQAAAAVVATTLKPAISAAQSKFKLVENEEYARLSQVVKEAGAVECKHSNALQQGRGRVSQELKDEYASALERKNEAAKRLREIEFEISPETRWHATAGWKAEDFFNDLKVIELCRAIENTDVPEMQRVIAAGADVNTIGKDGMTPLLWAFPDRKLERFECLLKHNANPNVTIRANFGRESKPFHPYPAGGSFYPDRGYISGKSVTHLAARSPEIEYLRLVLNHGGNPNLVDQETGVTPLDIVLERHFYVDMLQRVEMLISKGADVNHYCQYKGGTPAMLAVQADRFPIALYLLKAGADPTLYRPDGTEKLVHIVARKDERLKDFSPEMLAEYQALIDWLESHGESLAQAREDAKKWQEMHKKAFEPAGHARVRDEIIREQKRGGRPEAVPLDK